LTNPPPSPGRARATWELVIDDMKARDDLGHRRYGVRHQYDNGRDHLLDAYEEALNLSVYLRGEIEKRKANPNYSEVEELRKTITTLRHALGSHLENSSIETLLERIALLRSLVRK
jgi:hypothetical protein